MPTDSHATERTGSRKVRRGWTVVVLLVVAIIVVEFSLHFAVELPDRALPDWVKGLIDAVGMSVVIGPLFVWQLYRQQADAQLRDTAPDRWTSVSGSPHRRVRVAVLGSLAVIVTLVGGTLLDLLVTSRRAANDVAMINLAGRQRMLSQRVARFSATAILDQAGSDSLAVAVSRLDREAQAFDALVDSLSASESWDARAARHTLDEVADPLATLLSAARRLLQFPKGSPERLAENLRVQQATNRLLPVAERVVIQLQTYSEAQWKQRLHRSQVAAGLVLLVIVLIVALVIEPVVRLLKRQHAAITARSTEFERLAIVARRTSNAVVVTDAHGRITWVNDGFVRLSGYSMDEVMGGNPGELLQCERTDPGVLRQLRNALDAGESFCCEILNRSKDGRDFWINLSLEPLREQGVLTGFVAIESDITDLVCARDASQSQSRRLDLIVQSADLGTWEWDLESGDVLFNEHWKAMLGYTMTELRPHIETWRALSHPDDLVTVRKVMTAHLKGETSEYRCEQRLRRRDGTWCWVLAAGRVTERDVQGRAARAVGVHLDISSTREAKAELEAAHRRAKAMLREVSTLRAALDEHAILSVTDRAGRIIDVNTAFCRISGYSREALIGKDHRILNSGTHAKEFWPEVWRTIAAGRPWRGEVCNRRRDGSLYWVDSTIVPSVGDDGRIEKYVSIRLDVTAQKHADTELKRATDLLEEAQAVARLGSWSCNFSTGEISWSRELYRLYGRHEADGPPTYDDMFTDFVPEDADCFAAALRRTASDGSLYSLALRTRRGANGVRNVRVEGRALHDREGRIVGLFGTAMDVTVAVVREEALRRAQVRAETASQSKSEFLANMSHEIRTPLTAILGYAEVLREDALFAHASIGHMQTIDTIRRAGDHLLSVINDILDVSKIEAGRMVIECIETSLPHLLLDVDSLMRSRAVSKGVELRTSLTSAIPDHILSDPTRLRQILMNLVGNAAKFTEHGQVDIRVGVTEGPSGTTLRVAVEDTGPGLTAEQAALLFQPFTQADSSVTRRHGGTGLGLTICRRLARLMGGEVALVRTAPGEGACFELTLPLHAAPAAGLVHDLNVCIERPVRGNARPGANVGLTGRILLAEDGEDNRRLISFHLRKAGAEVVVAENGCRALDALRAADAAGQPFALLVSDMQMPEMDGYTLARTLRANGHTIPIVALTAHAMADDRQKCLDAGCDDYASKPIDKAALLATCAHWMGASSDMVEVFPAPAGIAPDETEMLYSELRDDPDLRELVDGFVAALPARLARLEASHDVGDLVELARSAHQLKGAAGGYGFPSITEAARQLERTGAAADDPGAIHRALDVLLARCHAAIRAQVALPPLTPVIADAAA